MSRPDLDADAAVKALAFRLRDWNVPDPAVKARAFIDDIQARGWKVTNEAPTARPPKKHEECATHAGQYRLSCSGCAADRKAAAQARNANLGPARMTRDEALARMRADVAAAGRPKETA